MFIRYKDVLHSVWGNFISKIGNFGGHKQFLNVDLCHVATSFEGYKIKATTQSVGILYSPTQSGGE